MANSVPRNGPTYTKNSHTNSINRNSSLALKPFSILSLLFNQFNISSPEQKTNLENIWNSNYYDIDQFKTLKLPEKIRPYPYLNIFI